VKENDMSTNRSSMLKAKVAGAALAITLIAVQGAAGKDTRRRRRESL
jgi:hypothetical protein